MLMKITFSRVTLQSNFILCEILHNIDGVQLFKWFKQLGDCPRLLARVENTTGACGCRVPDRMLGFDGVSELKIVESFMTDFTVAAQRALSLMDLTTLNEDDTAEKVVALCQQAKSPAGNTAAICIYPRFIPVARKALREQGTPDIRIATVTNFPHGNDDIEIALAETRAAIAYGADEVDVVFPYRALIEGNEQVGAELVKQCAEACHAANILLKVIIETGELKQDALIRKASQIAIEAGADFIKTSTGKVPENATLHSAELMLTVIKELNVADNVGFKPAGGVKTAEDAAQYLALAENILGREWADARHFRFGASSLLASLLTTLGHQTEKSTSGY